ncbi:hypothetical protein F1880_002237 [Penicillium rolfsii]|nr:hypothetical protein F1880_002237 [Penicillium rolfsii]
MITDSTVGLGVGSVLYNLLAWPPISDPGSNHPISRITLQLAGQLATNATGSKAGLFSNLRNSEVDKLEAIRTRRGRPPDQVTGPQVYFPFPVGHLMAIVLPKISWAIGHQGVRPVDIVRTWFGSAVNRGQMWRWGIRDSFIKELLSPAL